MSVTNYGLGPAFITQSKVWIDGVHVGHWGQEAMQVLRSDLGMRLTVVEMNRMPWVLPAGASRFLLSVDKYDDAQHQRLWNLIRNRLAVEFIYDSVYGGENFRLPYRLDTIAS